MKNPIFMGGGGVMKNQCMGRFPKGGTLDSLQSVGGGGLSKKEEGGVFEGQLISQYTL